MLLKQNVILVRQVNSHSMGHHARLVPLEVIALEGRQSVLSALLDTSKCAAFYISRNIQVNIIHEGGPWEKSEVTFWWTRRFFLQKDETRLLVQCMPLLPLVISWLNLYNYYCSFMNRCSNQTIDPVRCNPGEYAPTGQTNCTQCEKGFYCPDVPLASPLPCFNGTYTDAVGQTECNLCTAGNFCPFASQGEQPCQNGTYSKNGSSVCTECPGGHRWVVNLPFLKILLM